MEIPADPLRDWIEQRIAGGETHLALARRMGVDRRQLRRWRHGQVGRELAPIERALLRAGVLLGELYPELTPIGHYGRRIVCRACGFPMLEPAELCGFCIEETELAVAA